MSNGQRRAPPPWREKSEVATAVALAMTAIVVTLLVVFGVAPPWCLAAVGPLLGLAGFIFSLGWSTAS